MKTFFIIFIATLALSGCAGKNRNNGLLYRFSQERKMSEAVKLMEAGNEAAADRLLTEITAAEGVPGVTDEALFRLSLIHLRPGMEKDGTAQTQKKLEQLLKEYPDSGWARMAWPLTEFLTSVEDLRHQNRNLRILNLSLNRENKEQQHLKNLNISLTKENRELKQNIERLKHLDLELEQKTRH